MLSSSVRRGSDISGFILGLFVGAMTTAFVFVLLGSLLRAPFPLPVPQILVAVPAVILLLQEFGVLRFPILQNARLVPQFVTNIPFWGPVQFGIEMGTGMRTYSPTALPHIMAISIVFLASWQEALLAGAGFALGRAVMLLSFTAARSKMAADTAFYFDLPKIKPLFAVLAIPLVALLVIS
ncbi:hypothetical protein Sru01_07260 [Sphaerisporangium rufum]|uniref:Uncharacterized protein n=1 Tax=Sphaerisporangium rufum TaxID=1381558 RepID=A0A919QX47_9ACTN|nr:hypothetical protein [Sphaerisporangium rufum]GII75744.1 hypothetical protein Sru01_07260 [Sphaerisporangium rufum]